MQTKLIAVTQPRQLTDTAPGGWVKDLTPEEFKVLNEINEAS
jgi:hypothetical protein